MFSEITPVVVILQPVQEKDIPPSVRYEGELLALAATLLNAGSVNYTYKGKALGVSGIEGDARIYLDGQLVCECVYGNVYNANEELIKELGT